MQIVKSNRTANQLFNSLEADPGKKVHLTFFVIDVSIKFYNLLRNYISYLRVLQFLQDWFWLSSRQSRIQESKTMRVKMMP